MALLSGPAVADAIGDANNVFSKLVAAQPDPAKLVDEVFTRVLNRPAAENEIKKTLEAWATIDTENTTLLAELDAKEKEQAPLTGQAEAARLAAIEAAKGELARYEGEIAARLVEAEKKRVLDVAAAEQAVKDYEAQNLGVAQAAFEKAVMPERLATSWVQLDWAEMRATNGGELVKQPDGSLKAGGPRPGTTDYVVKSDTKLAGITGFLVEVLPDAETPAFGPGRFDDGNFVLGELALKMNVTGDATQSDVAFADAIADFSQANFEVKKAIDGKRGDGNNGWAVHPQFGVPHYAAFALKQPLGNAEKGVRLRFELHQPRPGGFSIARFRVWATTSPNPLNIGYPAPVAEALKKAAPTRSPEEHAALAAYWKESDPELRKRRFAHIAIQRPLPTDPGIVERRAAIARAEEPIKLDPRLVQLRADVEQSKAQLVNHRLTGVQDLAWALINTPAFLFNR